VKKSEKKNKTTLPDTNVILRYLLRDHEELFERASAFFEEVRIGTRKALILESVLTECVYVLTKFYKVPRTETADKLQGILRYKGICNPDRQSLLNALGLYKATSADIVDCILHQKAEGTDMEPLSFDADVTKKLPKTASSRNKNDLG
jgi:predicted nucleic-acid-binding protein